LLGDVVVCAAVVAEQARDQEKEVMAHWAHMVVHGVLHLRGFDHRTETEAQRMETLETQILAQLGYDNPYE
jgi:probable rRNA maturation factor